jgi:hypothetical protein
MVRGDTMMTNTFRSIGQIARDLVAQVTRARILSAASPAKAGRADELRQGLPPGDCGAERVVRMEKGESETLHETTSEHVPGLARHPRRGGDAPERIGGAER